MRLYRRPRSPYLYVEFYINSRPIRRSTGKTTKREAEKEAKKIIQKEVNLANTCTVGEWIDRALNHSLANKAPRTYQRDYSILMRLKDVLGRKRPLSDVSTYEISQWFDGLSRGRAPSGANRDLTILKWALNKAVEWDLLKNSPARYVRKLRVPEPPPDFYSRDDIRTIWGSEGVEKRYCLLGLYTGLRRAEYWKLRISPPDRRIIIASEPHSPTKTGKSRSVYIHDDILPIASSYEPPPWVPNVFTTKIKRFLEGIGLEAEHPLRKIRRTFGCHLAMKGTDVKTIQTLMGHASIGTSMKYYMMLSPRHLEGAVETLDFK